MIHKHNTQWPKGLAEKFSEDAQRLSSAYLDRSQYLVANTLTSRTMPDLGVSAKFTIFDEPKRQEDEEMRLSRILDKDTLFRFAYVPFVIAQLVWDYAETITDMAAMLRINETRKLCRAVKELRRDYDRIRAPHIDSAHEASEVSNMYVFEDCVADITKQLLLNLRINLRSEYPEIEEDYLSYLIAVYQCDITLKSLLLYTRRQTEIIAKKIDRNVGHILPESVYKLNHLVLEFVGDKPVSDKFATLKKQYIETFATQIALAELTELPGDNE